MVTNDELLTMILPAFSIEKERLEPKQASAESAVSVLRWNQGGVASMSASKKIFLKRTAKHLHLLIPYFRRLVLLCDSLCSLSI